MKALIGKQWLVKAVTAVSVFVLSSGVAFAKQQNVADISIPGNFGEVKEKFEGTSAKTVVHIQDAHCNYDAQINISNIIKELVAENEINLIAVEGAKGEVDTKILATIPDERVKNVVADYFVRNGDITGADLASAVLNQQIDLFGVENVDTYNSNRKAFVETLQQRGVLEEKTAKIKWLLVQLKERIFSAEAKELFATIEDYAKDRIPLSRYCVYLKSISEEQSVSLSSFANFAQIVDIVDMEENIDFSRVETERLQVVEALEAKLSKSEVSELVSKSLYFRLGKVSAKDYYNYLNSMIEKADVDVKEYTNLSTYIQLVNLYEKVNSDKLFDELEAIESAVKEKVYKTDAEKELDTFFRNIEVLSNLCSLKMTRKDLDYYNNNKESFQINKFVKFIRNQMVKFNLSFPIDSELSVIEQVVPALENFYNLALKRDEVMVKNLLSRMKNAKKDKAILITGGFHSRGVLEQLKEKNISYMVVMPKINSIGDTESIYLNRITGGAYTAMSGVALNFLQTPNSLSPELVGNDEFIRFQQNVVTAVTAVAKEESVAVGLLKDSEAIGEQFKDLYANALKVDNKADVLKDVFQESLPSIKVGDYIVCPVKQVNKADNTESVLTFVAKMQDGKLVGLQNMEALSATNQAQMNDIIAETLAREGLNSTDKLSVALKEFTLFSDIVSTLSPEQAATLKALLDKLTPIGNMAKMNAINLEVSEIDAIAANVANTAKTFAYNDVAIGAFSDIATQLNTLEGYNLNLGETLNSMIADTTPAPASNVDIISNYIVDMVRARYGENVKAGTNIGTIKAISDLETEEFAIKAADDLSMGITFADEATKDIFAFRVENANNIDVYVSDAMIAKVEAGDKEATMLFANAIAEELLEAQGFGHDMKSLTDAADAMQPGIEALVNNIAASANTAVFSGLYSQLEDIDVVSSQDAAQKEKVSEITASLKQAVVAAVADQSEFINADALVYKLLGSEDILVEEVKDGNNTPEKVRAEVESLLKDKGVLNDTVGNDLTSFINNTIAELEADADAGFKAQEIGTVNPLVGKAVSFTETVDNLFNAKLNNSFAAINKAREDVDLAKFEKNAQAGTLHISLAKAINLRLEDGQVKYKQADAVAALIGKYKGATVYANRSELASILGVEASNVEKELEPIMTALVNAGVKVEAVNNVADMLAAVKDSNDYVMISEFEGNKNPETVKAFNQSGKIDVLGDNISIFKVADYINNALSLKLDDFREARIDFIMEIFSSVGVKRGSEEWHSIRKNLQQAKDALIYITAVPLGKLSTEEINFDHITETSLALYA